LPAVTDTTPIHRLELAISLLGLTALMTAVIVTLDAARFHGAELVALATGASLATLDGESVVVMIAAFMSVTAAGVATRAGARQLRAERAFMRALPLAGRTTVDGRDVTIVRGGRSAAFCAGHLRPRIFVSEAAFARLSPAELSAVVAHEGHHVDRRDPLRLLVGRALAQGVGRIPGASALERRRAVLTELAADAAAVGAAGDPAPLAGALLAFDEQGGVAPERVDRLLGGGPATISPNALLTVVCLALAGLIALIALVVAAHPPHALVPAPLLIAAAAAVTSRALRAGFD
jgi:Zn-dependent protease with chaperone function